MDYPDGGTIGLIDNSLLTIGYEPFLNFFGKSLSDAWDAGLELSHYIKLLDI